MKKKYPAGVLATGVGLAVLASEYPEKFEKVRRSLPDYFDRGMRVMEMAAQAGKRITEAAGRSRWRLGKRLGMRNGGLRQIRLSEASAQSRWMRRRRSLPGLWTA